MRDLHTVPRDLLATPRTIPAALRAESLKVRHSRVPVVTLAAFAIAPLTGGLFMFILADPERARSMGLLGAKAQLFTGSADWPGYLDLLAQAYAVAGLLIFSLVFIWLFGREFTEGTMKDLLALPTSRVAIVAAKLALGAGWCFALAGAGCGVALVTGAVLGLPGWSAGLALESLGRLAWITALTVLLTVPFALAASVFRGYLAPFGALIGTVFAAQITAALGYGHVFPWSVPSVYAGTAGPEQADLGAASYLVVVLAGAAAVAATAAWWRHADQDR